MSAAARALVPATPAAPAPLPVKGAKAASLRLVPPRRSKVRRAPFLAVVLGLLAAGLLSLLALNTLLAQDAFTLHELQVQGKQLSDREQELQSAVDALQAPRAIADRAAGLGMVQGGPPAFLRLPDGALLGGGAAADAPGQVAEGSPAAGDQSSAPAGSTAPDVDIAATVPDVDEAGSTR